MTTIINKRFICYNIFYLLLDAGFVTATAFGLLFATTFDPEYSINGLYIMLSISNGSHTIHTLARLSFIKTLVSWYPRTMTQTSYYLESKDLISLRIKDLTYVFYNFFHLIIGLMFLSKDYTVPKNNIYFVSVLMAITVMMFIKLIFAFGFIIYAAIVMGLSNAHNQNENEIPVRSYFTELNTFVNTNINRNIINETVLRTVIRPLNNKQELESHPGHNNNNNQFQKEAQDQQHQQDQQDHTCIICMDQESTEDEWVVLHCNHEFHYNCALPWLSRNTTCPLCRVDIFQQPVITNATTATAATSTATATANPDIPIDPT
jgi:hypothetical protein